MRITTPTGTLEGDNIEKILKAHGFDCLRDADLRYTDLRGADLRGADLSGAGLSGADLSRADLSGADLSRADLRGADLSRADLSRAGLSGADLRGADLSGADLSDAYLRGADLSRADLSGADLSRAGLSGADLRYTDLRYTDLSYADLRGADLSRADLRGADLSRADLSDAKLSGPTVAQTSILPEGDIIGWKKAYVDDTMSPKPVIVKLLIPSDAQRSNATGRKCRADKARVLDLQDKQGNSLPPNTTAHSSYDTDFRYEKGETVSVENFDTNRWNECAPGIHFFITRVEAVEY